MAKDPAFLFYPGDYLRDTQTLSEKSQVSYDRIMCEHMRNICISKQQLKFFTKRLNDEELEELMFVLTEIDGGYQIEWIAESINKRKAYSDSRRKNRKGKNKEDKINICKTHVIHMENENENENEDLNDNDLKFQKFLCDKFSVTEITQPRHFMTLTQAIIFMKNQSEEINRHFRDQCWNYFKYKDEASEKKHNSIESFLFDMDQEEYIDRIMSGGWNKSNWIELLKKINKSNYIDDDITPEQILNSTKK